MTQWKSSIFTCHAFSLTVIFDVYEIIKNRRFLWDRNALHFYIFNFVTAKFKEFCMHRKPTVFECRTKLLKIADFQCIGNCKFPNAPLRGSESKLEKYEVFFYIKNRRFFKIRMLCFRGIQAQCVWCLRNSQIRRIWSTKIEDFC